jgi:iron complex outermembrane receptor protein
MSLRLFAGGLAALLCLAAHALQAQPAATVSVTGTVTTRDDGLPLPGATVSIDSLNLSTVTDAEGRYRLEVPASAAGRTVEIKVTAPGLAPKTMQVRLEGAVTHDFALALGFHEEVTVGSRAVGAEAEKAVPVDIITSRQIATTGASETSAILQALAPSFNFPRPTISDGADTVRPATLRGLAPDQVLVLVNGKRRHTGAHIVTSNVIGRGTTGVDLNAIPASAIERIEVLRDGAAAQYGSDAIAGVINIVLKSGQSPLTLSGKAGMTMGSFTDIQGNEVDHSDGELTEGTATKGFSLGRGAVTVTTEYRNRNGTQRASPDVRDQIRTGDASSNPVEQPNHHWGDSEQRDVMAFVNAAVPVGESETTSFYAFGGWSRRTGSHGGFFRRALDARNWPQIYPLGFLPTIQPEVVDASATVGLRGARSDWFWDLTAQYGHNSFDFHVVNSLNTSLGPAVPPNQSDFYSGSLIANQLVSNLDLSREVSVGLAEDVNVAFGLEFRRENYQIIAGEPNSYLDGGVLDQFRGRAPAGAQVFPGFRPSNEVDDFRNSVAAYVDVEGDLHERFRLGLAGRFENYDDFGSTANGKVTARLEAHPRFIVRGALSTGFRAPSLAQTNFSTVSTNFISVGGVITPVEVGTFAVFSPVARALGATDLEPEESVHYSAGVVLNPVDRLELTADVYRVDIDRRIVLSGNFSGPRIEALVRPFGASGGRFFTNAIDTQTDGADVTAAYRWEFAEARSLRVTAGYNHTTTDIVGDVIATPPQLSGLGNVLFDREQIQRIECGQPRDSVRLAGDWQTRRWGAVVRTSRYGEYCFPTNVPANDQTFSPKWVADLELSYRADRFTLAAGAQNLFDVFPDHLTRANSSFLVQTFSGANPFGFNGRYLYVRATLRY